MRRQTQTTATAAAETKLVREARETLAKWEAELRACEAAFADLQGRAGAEVLDDPEAADRIPRELTALRDRIDVAEKAIEAQRPRVRTAESAYLLAEAAALQPAVAVARANLEKHNARTAELLAQLESHEGKFVPELALTEELRTRGMPYERELSKSEILQEAVDIAQRPILVLEAMARGEDPAAIVSRWAAQTYPDEHYPACVWGPAALVPAPAYKRQVAEAKARIEQLRTGAVPSAQRHLAECTAALEEAAAAGRREQTRPAQTSMHPATLRDKADGAKSKLSAVEAELGAAVARLASLSGETQQRRASA